MKAHDVPDWYIWSCKKIKYMFPKAHAAAYVMMAWRIAYCKVFYPLAYYASFFSIRASAFSYEIMCLGREKLDRHIADYKRRSDSLSKKEQDTMRDMRIVQEMYARGFEFHQMDVFKAKARHFQIIDNKLMPSINSIDGLGEKAAESISFVTAACCLYDAKREQLLLFYQAEKQDDVGVVQGLKQILPRFMVPGRLYYFENLPENRTGKIDRAGLRQLYLQG